MSQYWGYVLYTIVLIPCFFIIWIKNNDRRFSLSLIQSVICLLGLSGVYSIIYFSKNSSWIALMLAWETGFAWGWLQTALWIRGSIGSQRIKTVHFVGYYILPGIISLAFIVFFLFTAPVSSLTFSMILFFHKGPIIGSWVFVLISLMMMLIHLEQFWRGLPMARKWEYKYLLIGAGLVCCVLGWSGTYRLTLMKMPISHLPLLAILVLVGTGFMVYAMIRHRLLNRKIFISRKVVYSAVVPGIFVCYGLIMLVATLLIRFVGLPFPDVIRWLIFSIGLVILVAIIFSATIRRKIRFFISTNFYNNKYEYRDEWLAFSRMLQNVISESHVVDSLHHVLTESLYTHLVIIWLGDQTQGYHIVRSGRDGCDDVSGLHISPDHEVIHYLKNHQYLYLEEKHPKRSGIGLTREIRSFFLEHQIVLIVPMTLGDHPVGLIGVGPEFTGGRYGQDDFDLLTALSTQAASSIMAVRMGDALARARQLEALNAMSAFILHDVKNAASMLSLIRHNAPSHINDPTFQQDLLETLDDALRRMTNLQNRLNLLGEDIVPQWEKVEIQDVIKDGCKLLEKRIPEISCIAVRGDRIQVETDPELIHTIEENLVLNALEAGSSCVEICIDCQSTEKKHVKISFTDNGSGIPHHLLPDGLFEPFKTTKPNGSGIGLWQVKRLVLSLGGTITVENSNLGGARFVISLPIHQPLAMA